MTDWFTEMGKILEPVFGKPGSPPFMMQTFIACLTYLIIFRTAAKAFGVKRDDWPRTLISSGVTLAAMLLAMVASRFHFPLEFVPDPWRDPFVGLLAVLVVGIPIHCLILKGNALKVFPALVMGIIAGSLMLVFVQMVGDALQSGGTTVSPARKHRQETERMLNNRQ